MHSETGKVYLVGAGPGDKGLITIKALEKLKEADVVVFDRLINNELLSFCRKDCEKIFVGKESGSHLIEQEKITNILIQKSKQGKTVVRLKGGNPFVFGRGAEEAIALKNEDILFEVVPGVTSGVAAPMYSGIPVTHRGLITQCIFITAHECPTKPGTQVEWEKLAKLKNTSLVIYMGASRIEAITEKLITNGMDPRTPVAAIENGTLPNQRTLTAKLDNFVSEFRRQKFHAPVIIIISPTVKFRKDISWYEKKPLFNKRVIFVDSQEYPTDLDQLFYESAAEIIHLPVIKTKVKIPDADLRKLFSESNFDWILFTSKEGVEYFFEILNKAKLDARIFGGKKIATIGADTTKAIKYLSLTPDYESDDFASNLFNNDFIEKFGIENKQLLRIKDDYSYDRVYEELNRAGALVKSIEVFNTFPNQPGTDLISNIKNHYTDVLIFTSPQSIDNFFNVLGPDISAEILNNCGEIFADPITPSALLDRNYNGFKISTNVSSSKICDIVGKLI